MNTIDYRAPMLERPLRPVRKAPNRKVRNSRIIIFLLEAFILVTLLYYMWISSYLEWPPITGMLWIPLLLGGLIMERRRLHYPRAPLYLASLAMCLVPIIKNTLVRDWPGVAESGMIMAGFAAAPFCGLYFRSNKMALMVMMIFVLPLCVAGYLMGVTESTSILGGFALARGALHPPDGTHHFLGGFAGIMVCLTWRRMNWKYVAFFTFLMILSGARTYWFAVALSVAIGEFMQLPGLRPRYLLFGTVFGLIVSTAVLIEPWVGETVGKAEWTRYFSLGGGEEVAKAGVFTGRSDLWTYYLTLYHERRRTGWPTEYIRPQKVWNGNALVSEGADGEILHAGTESQFDYYLARDGIWGFAAIAMYACLAAYFQKGGMVNSVILVIFVTAAGFGNPISRVTYAPVFIMFAAALWAASSTPRYRPNELDLDDPSPSPSTNALPA